MSWQEWLNVQNLLTVARLTCQSAVTRKESRGSHYRSDFPRPDDQNWLCNVLIQREGEETRIRQEPVSLSRLSPDSF